MGTKTISKTPMRAPRAFYFKDSLSVRLSLPELGSEEIQIRNISTTGARLEPSSPLVGLEEAKTYSALLHFRDDFICPVQIKIIYLKGNAFGVEFVSPSRRLQSFLSGYFKTEFAGASLQKELSNKSHLICSSHDGEREDRIQAKFKDGKLESLSASLNSLDCYLDWHLETGLQSKPQGSVETVLQVIRNIEGLSPDERTSFESLI
jgi:hypothetical protein